MKVNLSGMENLEEEEYELTRQMAEKTAKRNRYINALDLVVNTQRDSGKRRRFSISAKALTEYGFFKAEASEWKLNIAVKEVLRKLDKHIHNELKRKKGD